MRKRAKKYLISYYHSISFKLFLLSLMLVLVLFGLYSTIYSTKQKRIYEDLIGLSAYRVSDIIKKSLYRYMLTNERDELYRAIVVMGAEPGMELIRIYNKKGEIKFSTKESETGQIVDMKAEACYACHAANQPIQSLPTKKKTRIYQSPDGRRIMGLINPIKNAPECSNQVCHAHQPDQTILGVLDVQMTLGELDLAEVKTRWAVLTVSIILVVLAAFLFGGIVYLLIYRPIHTLQTGTIRLATGDLDYRITLERRDELGMLARSFNNMAENLKKAYTELKDWSTKLEKRVEEKTEELEQMHHNMLQVEKMASLGKMAATVAHELNNPLAGIVTYAKLLQKRVSKSLQFDGNKDKMIKDLDLIQSESMRCGNIVRNLLAFARGTSTHFQPCNLHGIVERAMGIVKHHMELANVEASSHVEIEPANIICDSDQLLQALVALIVNAVEAMPGGGQLEIAARNVYGELNHILISVKDTGVGISEEVRGKIFEPFVTTKKDKKGVGLGLAVVYGIVQRHKGRIWVESKEGEGTTFFIELPMEQNGENNNDSGKIES